MYLNFFGTVKLRYFTPGSRSNDFQIMKKYFFQVDPVTKERRHKDHPEIWELPKDDAQTILEGKIWSYIIYHTKLIFEFNINLI